MTAVPAAPGGTRTAAIVLRDLRLAPHRPHAGGQLSARVGAVSAPSMKPLAHATVTCRGVAGGRALPVVSHSFHGGVAACTWRVPGTALVSATIVVSERRSRRGRRPSRRSRPRRSPGTTARPCAEERVGTRDGARPELLEPKCARELGEAEAAEVDGAELRDVEPDVGIGLGSLDAVRCHVPAAGVLGQKRRPPRARRRRRRRTCARRSAASTSTSRTHTPSLSLKCHAARLGEQQEQRMVERQQVGDELRRPVEVEQPPPQLARRLRRSA